MHHFAALAIDPERCASEDGVTKIHPGRDQDAVPMQAVVERIMVLVDEVSRGADEALVLFDKLT